MPDQPVMTNLRRSAILLMALDDDSAAAVLRFLPADEVKIISQEAAHLNSVSRDDMMTALDAFHSEVDTYAEMDVNASDRVRALLEKALGAERASVLMEGLFDEDDRRSGIDSLNLMDADAVSEIIRDEHPQIIATILVHLERKQAADVLATFDDALRNDVMLRIATFNGVQPAAMQELTVVLGGMLDGQTLRRSKMGGAHTAAEILNLMSSAHEEGAIGHIRSDDEELANNIIDEMFRFDNLADMDDVSMQRLLRDVDTNSLKVALKGSQEPLRDKFLKNMSTRAAQILRDEMESSGPVRLSQVEKEQKAILQIARRLADSGEIVLRGADDAYV